MAKISKLDKVQERVGNILGRRNKRLGLVSISFTEKKIWKLDELLERFESFREIIDFSGVKDIKFYQVLSMSHNTWRKLVNIPKYLRYEELQIISLVISNGIDEFPTVHLYEFIKHKQ